MLSNDGGTKWSWFLAPALVFALGACAPEGDDMAEGDFDTGEEMADRQGGVGADDTARRDAPAGRGMDDGGIADLTLRQSSQFGEYVARSDGRPVYMFTADQQGESSTCYDACAEAWPPLTGQARAGSGMDSSMLGTISRDDGVEQVTYNGWPLYEYFRDSGTEPTGQDIESFGGEWYLVGPDGEQIEAEAAAAEPGTDAEGQDQTDMQQQGEEQGIPR